MWLYRGVFGLSAMVYGCWLVVVCGGILLFVAYVVGFCFIVGGRGFGF